MYIQSTTEIKTKGIVLVAIRSQKITMYVNKDNRIKTLI